MVGYEWPDWALDGLRGVEPHEVMEVLGASRRWPRRATGPGGVQLVAVWARTRRGRPLIVAVRQVGEWDWWIVGARDLTGADLVALEGWEEARDE